MTQCPHTERVEGVCTACGDCAHDVILNGACLACGATDIDPVARSPRPELGLGHGVGSHPEGELVAPERLVRKPK